ncbi:DUF397 domain-containing protein [Streptomyces sp. NPDC002324]
MDDNRSSPIYNRWPCWTRSSRFTLGRARSASTLIGAPFNKSGCARGSCRCRSRRHSTPPGPDFPGLVPVRDSKNPAGGVLVFGAAAWSHFVAAAREG